MLACPRDRCILDRSACKKWQVSDCCNMSITNRLLMILPDRRMFPCFSNLKVLGLDNELTCNNAPFTIRAPREIKLTVDSGTQTASERVRKVSLVANETSPDSSTTIAPSFCPVRILQTPFVNVSLLNQSLLISMFTEHPESRMNLLEATLVLELRPQKKE